MGQKPTRKGFNDEDEIRIKIVMPNFDANTIFLDY